MKKTAIIIGSGLAALSAMAYVDITGITTPLPSSGSPVSITESMIGQILNGGMTYQFDANDVMIVHSAPIPRHVSNSIIFNTNGHTGLTIASSAKSSGFGKWYNYFGFNNAQVTGGGEVSFDSTADASPVWFNSLTIDATTVNMNLAADKFLRAADALSAATVTLKNGATLNWNSAVPTQFYLNGKDSSTAGTWVANTKEIAFSASGSTRSVVNFSSSALTNVDGVGDVLYNFSSSGVVNYTFDASLGSDIIMYNNTGTRLSNSARTILTTGQTLTYKASSDSTAPIAELNLHSPTTTTYGTYVFDFNGTMSAINQADANSRGVVKVVAGRNIVVTGRSSANTVNLIIEDGASFAMQGNASGTSTAGNNIMNNLIVGTGSSFTVAGGLRTAGMNIDGDLVVNGTGRKTSPGSVDDFIIGFNNSNVLQGSTTNNQFTFGANATLTQAYQSDGAKNWTTTTYRSGDITITNFEINSATSSINFGNKVMLARGTSFTLNTADAIVMGSGEAWGAISQATSVFTFDDYILNGGEANLRNLYHVFTINAANNIGAFSFDAQYHKVKLVFGESGSLTLGAEDGEYFTSLRGSYLTDDCVVIEGPAFQKLKVFDFTSAEIEQYFTVADTEAYYLDVVAADANSYWVNAIAVPEPAEFAAIFGALALAVAAYRRRR